LTVDEVKIDVPSLASTEHLAALEHCTEVTATVPVGEVTAVQVDPPSSVVKTTPVPGSAPVEPTAMHTVTFGHEIPVSAGAGLPPTDWTGWAVHVAPALAVATITVAAAVAVALSFGPGTPTAQQCTASAHDTALSSPVPAGAGCPTTVGDPDCCPSTFGVVVCVRWPAAEQEALVTAKIIKTAATQPLPVGRTEWLSDGELKGTAGGQ
jgi:hypothetical protein